MNVRCGAARRDKLFGNHYRRAYSFSVSTVTEIEAALEEMPLQDAQTIAQWLQHYLDRKQSGTTASPAATAVSVPDYAARRRMTFGDKVLPNLVLLGREEERW